MDLIIDLLKKYEEEQNLRYNSLQNEINNIKKLHNNSSNIIYTLTKEKEELYEENKEMQNVSIIIRLTNEKISLKKENELLLKRIEYLTKKKNINEIEIIKENIKLNNNVITKNLNNRVNNVINSYTKNIEIVKDTDKNIKINSNNSENTIETSLNNSENTIETSSDNSENTIETSLNNSENTIETSLNNSENTIKSSLNNSGNIIETSSNNSDNIIEISSNNSDNITENTIKTFSDNIIKNSIEISTEHNSQTILDNNLEIESDVEEISYRVKKIKGTKYFIDKENIIYSVTEENDVGEKVGKYILNKNNILKPKFF